MAGGGRSRSKMSSELTRRLDRILGADSEESEDDSYEKSHRPTLTETMMSIASTLSLRSTCMRGHVGCVVTDADGFILSTGYNGAPRGMPHCFEAGCLIVDGHCVRTAHAE